MATLGKVSATLSSPAPAAQVRAEAALGPTGFACAWVTTACVHGINGAFLGAASALYWYITTPDMEYFVPTLQLPTLPILRLIGAAYAAVSVCHGFALGSMIVSSLRRKEFKFGVSQVNPQAIHPHRERDSAPQRGRQTTQSRRMLRTITRIRKGLQSVFYMDGQHFELGFELRETLEVVCQTYQVFYLSRSISTKWINELAVSTLVINCVATPIIHLFQRKGVVSIAQARILCVLCDALLDFISAVIVPLAVFVPYWREFDVTIHDFADGKTYDEVWYTNAIQENRQLFVLTSMDFLSTMLPHISLLVCVRSLKRRIVRVSSTAPMTRSSASNPSNVKGKAGAKLAQWLQYLLMAWGACIIAAHVVAQHDSGEVSSCKLYNNGWLLDGFPCAVADLNCHRLGTAGSREDIEHELKRFSRPSLRLLAITHCPQLHLPSLISEFPALKALIVLNSTIIGWEEQAGDAVKTFDYVEFVHANFTGAGELPAALTSGRVVVNDFEVFDSNITELPANIDVLWPEMVTLYVEFTGVETIPLEVFRLEHLMFLSLVGNRIRSLPDEALSSPTPSALQYLTLSENPLENLPPFSTDQIVFGLQELAIENTLVTEFPSWTSRWLTECSASSSDCLLGFGSSWCEAEPDMGFSESQRDHICSKDRETSSGLVPVDRITSQHSIMGDDAE